MATTPEQRKKLALMEKANKEKRREREKNMQIMKKSHNWHVERVFDRSRGAGHNSISHCKDCGINYMYFKFNPIECDSNIVKDIVE